MHDRHLQERRESRCQPGAASARESLSRQRRRGPGPPAGSGTRQLDAERLGVLADGTVVLRQRAREGPQSVCIDRLRAAPRRPLPRDLNAPALEIGAPLAPTLDVEWVGPATLSV